MLKEILNSHRELRIELNKLLQSDVVNEDLIKIIDGYFTSYINYYKLNSTEVLWKYFDFTEQYSQQVEEFNKTGKYPYALGNLKEIDRMTYDIALMISTVINEPRHRIMNEIYQFSRNLTGETILVGAGSGLEIEIITKRKPGLAIDIFDVSLSYFVKQHFLNHNINERYFSGANKKYDNAVAIELLEHVEEPKQFLELISESLNKDGVMYTTTATNIPQFDHVYNFTDGEKFKQDLSSLGFSVEESKEFFHPTQPNMVVAKNNWYRLKKNK